MLRVSNNFFLNLPNKKIIFDISGQGIAPVYNVSHVHKMFIFLLYAKIILRLRQ